MLRNEKIQLAGPVGVIAALACAEAGARALGYWPSSPLLWYLNLEVFRPVQYSFAPENALMLGDLARTLSVAAPLFALVCIGLVARKRFPLALASNLSLLYSGFLLYGSYLANYPAEETKVKVAALLAPSFLLAVAVMLAAFLSSLASHRAYWREIFS
jgi:hypothetical protein